ncbi:MAG: hypothetical protein D3910_07730 [Candidatus Electrothrix sp. ATG2]|nr:hypothetical protein [Candidatus Electrothrix sp. ATG2]
MIKSLRTLREARGVAGSFLALGWYLLVIAALLCAAPPQAAQALCTVPQTGPPSDHGDAIWWFDWAGLSLSAGGSATRSFTLPDGRTINATVTMLSGSGVEGIGVPTDWPIAVLMGTTSGKITASMVPTLRNYTVAENQEIRVTFSEPINLIAADGEKSTPNFGGEYIQFTTNGGVWEEIDSYLPAEFSMSDLETQTTRMTASNQGDAYGTPLLLSRNATVATFYLDTNTSGKTGVILGVYLGDTGDAPASYGSPSHRVERVNPFCTDHSTQNLYIGVTAPDGEWPDSVHSADASGDESQRISDEDGVSFYSPAGGGVYADAQVVNDTGADAYVCAWLDRWTDGGGTAVLDGTFDAGDIATSPAQVCQTVVDNGGGTTTVTFNWSGLPAVSGYTYLRFRVCTTQSECQNPDGFAANGEVEDYRVAFNFAPTAVTIGDFAMETRTVDDYLSELGVERMDQAELLSLIRSLTPNQPASESDDTATLIAQLRAALDPDNDGQVALLRWDTLEERGTIGFYVHRRQGTEGDWTRINNDMLPGLITAPMGEPGVGDYFFKYVHDHQLVERNCLLVQITQDKEKGFVEFPDHPDLYSFDPSDRKFVAVAMASGLNPAICNATDSDWAEHKAALRDVQVSVVQLCPQHASK